MSTFQEAAKRMQLRVDILKAKTGRLYQPELSDTMRNAIRNNKDSFYEGSQAVDVAVNSTTNWHHQGDIHRLPIRSFLWANYRQYGCGGIPIAELVKVLERDKEEQRKLLGQVLHNPERLE